MAQWKAGRGGMGLPKQNLFFAIFLSKSSSGLGGAWSWRLISQHQNKFTEYLMHVRELAFVPRSKKKIMKLLLKQLRNLLHVYDFPLRVVHEHSQCTQFGNGNSG